MQRFPRASTDSPPPCGEGLGVGVTQARRLRGSVAFLTSLFPVYPSPSRGGEYPRQMRLHAWRKRTSTEPRARYVARRSENGVGGGAPRRRGGRRARCVLAADGAAAARPRRGPFRHRARSQRPPAARLHHARRPLAAAGRGQGRRRSLPCHAAGVRGQALPFPSRRRPLRARARRMAARPAWAHRLGRLDADHAGGAAAAGRARALRRRQAAAGPAGVGA